MRDFDNPRASRQPYCTSDLFSPTGFILLHNKCQDDYGGKVERRREKPVAVQVGLAENAMKAYLHARIAE